MRCRILPNRAVRRKVAKARKPESQPARPCPRCARKIIPHRVPADGGTSKKYSCLLFRWPARSGDANVAQLTFSENLRKLVGARFAALVFYWMFHLLGNRILPKTIFQPKTDSKRCPWRPEKATSRPSGAALGTRSRPTRPGSENHPASTSRTAPRLVTYCTH